ncbi:hypothetical protein HDU85_002502 [Gaertneriomyces sp. JEL0708]|nr:hypothetical protein HDU85_002502 [Gaertneriomyces sp. JEL0708]
MDADTAKLRHVKNALQTETETAVPKIRLPPVKRHLFKNHRIFLSFVKQFVEFLSKRNLLDTGIGIVIGSSFSAMIQTLVDDLLTPLLGLIVGSRMSNWFFVLRRGPLAKKSGRRPKYLTVAEANADGAVILNFGRAAESTVRFICVATAVFAVWKMLTNIHEANKTLLTPILGPPSDQGEPPELKLTAPDRVNPNEPTKECPECVSKIPVRASRCPFCTSEVATLKGGVVILHH